MKIISYLILFLVLAPYAFSQGALLERGKSAVGLSAGYAHNKNNENVLGTIGYSLKGLLDFQYGLGKTTLSPVNVDKIDGTLQYLGFEFFFVKQDTVKKPVTLGINFGYSWMKLNNRYNGIRNEDNFLISGDISWISLISETYSVQTAFMLGWSLGSSTQSLIYGVDISFIHHFSNRVMFVAGPNVAFSKNIVSLGVSGGVVVITGGL